MTEWSEKVFDTCIDYDPGYRPQFVVGGGSENGQFLYLERVHRGDVRYYPQKFLPYAGWIPDWLQGDRLVGELRNGDILLEAGEISIVGLRQIDMTDILRGTVGPLPLKCVPAQYLSRNLFDFLTMDSHVSESIRQLQRARLTFLTPSVTTRPPRPDETHGKDYIFESKQDFFELIQAGRIIHYKRHDDEFYGILKPDSAGLGPCTKGFVDVLALGLRRQLAEVFSLILESSLDLLHSSLVKSPSETLSIRRRVTSDQMT